MAEWQGKSNRKATGGRYILSRGKRKFEISREKQNTRLGAESRKTYRGMGGSHKTGLMVAKFANVINKKDNVVKKVKILSVVSNPADPNYVQRNIMNKSAVVSTELGNAVITSRPGQDGAVNAVLL